MSCTAAGSRPAASRIAPAAEQSSSVTWPSVPAQTRCMASQSPVGSQPAGGRRHRRAIHDRSDEHLGRSVAGGEGGGAVGGGDHDRPAGHPFGRVFQPASCRGRSRRSSRRPAPRRERPRAGRPPRPGPPRSSGGARRQVAPWARAVAIVVEARRTSITTAIPPAAAPGGIRWKQFVAVPVHVANPAVADRDRHCTTRNPARDRRPSRHHGRRALQAMPVRRPASTRAATASAGCSPRSPRGTTWSTGCSPAESTCSGGGRPSAGPRRRPPGRSSTSAAAPATSRWPMPPRRGPTCGSWPATSAGRCSTAARRRRRGPAGRSSGSRPTRWPCPFADDRVRSRHGRLRPAKHRRHDPGPGRDGPGHQAGRPAGDPRVFAAPVGPDPLGLSLVLPQRAAAAGQRRGPKRLRCLHLSQSVGRGVSLGRAAGGARAGGRLRRGRDGAADVRDRHADDRHAGSRAAVDARRRRSDG